MSQTALSVLGHWCQVKLKFWLAESTFTICPTVCASHAHCWLTRLNECFSTKQQFIRDCLRNKKVTSFLLEMRNFVQSLTEMSFLPVCGLFFLVHLLCDLQTKATNPAVRESERTHGKKTKEVAKTWRIWMGITAVDFQWYFTCHVIHAAYYGWREI